jgi:hypothetical protein
MKPGWGLLHTVPILLHSLWSTAGVSCTQPCDHLHHEWVLYVQPPYIRYRYIFMYTF